MDGRFLTFAVMDDRKHKTSAVDGRFSMFAIMDDRKGPDHD